MSVNKTCGLSDALGASTQKRALYEDGGRRAFVSERGEKFDLGVNGPAGKVTKFDQTAVVLDTILALHGIPRHSGWKSM